MKTKQVKQSHTPGICFVCRKSYKPKRKTSKFCSRICLWSTNGGQNKKDGPIWYTNQKGYIQGTVWLDGKRIQVKQHRWLMEQYLKRPLLRNEDVHHINGIKHDNRLENLEVIGHGEHTVITHLGRRKAIAKAEGK